MSRKYWFKFLILVIATFTGAFLAFYLSASIAFQSMTQPEYLIKQMDKAIKINEKKFREFEKNIIDNPFEPKMTPTIVNLIKEPKEYKVIVDLKPLDGEEKAVNLQIFKNKIFVSGEIEKSEHKNEEILHFAESFYVEETIKETEISREKRGNKLIITLPFEIKE